MAKALLINKLFDEYDGSGALSAEFSNEHLKKVAGELNLATSTAEKQAVRAKVPPKVKAIIKIVNSVGSTLNAKLKALGFDYRFEVNNKVTYSATEKFNKLDVNYAGKTINFNIKKLSKLPALELYAYVTKALYEMASNELLASKDSKDKESKLEDLIEVASKNTNLNPEDYEKAKTILSGYLEKFIARHFSTDFKRFKNIADFVAGQILAELDEKDLKNVLNKFFDFESIQGLATDEVNEFIGFSEVARVSCISKKATHLLLGRKDENGNYIEPSPEDELVALGYHEQAQELMSEYVIAKFRKIDKNGKIEYSTEFKNLCEAYATKFMASNGLVGISINFESKGGKGTFYDSGSDSQRININLDKIVSLTDLVMTLSHELTHAVDASQNMAKGYYNEHGGGLLNQIDEDISRSGLEGKNLQLLQELKSYCYHINPNERHARINEVSALEFMKTVGAGDPNIESEIKNSVLRFKEYQQKTIDFINGNKQKNIPSLAQKIKEFESRFANATGVGKVASKMISERIDYLKDMLNMGLETQSEIDSIKSANEILGIKEAEKNVKKQLEEEQALEM